MSLLRSIPRKWAGDKPQFKTAFPDSKLFDFYDTRMLLRPVEEDIPLFTLSEIPRVVPAKAKT